MRSKTGYIRMVYPMQGWALAVADDGEMELMVRLDNVIGGPAKMNAIGTLIPAANPDDNVFRLDLNAQTD